MRVCLVRLPSPFLIDERCFPPLGLLAVGTYLKQLGHDVVIHDGPLDSVPLDFEYYGLGPTIAEYSSAVNVLKTLKAISPSPKVVVGGPYATINPDICLRDGFDCVVQGDGESSVEEAFLGQAKVLRGEEAPLDTYPIIDRSLIDVHSYKYLLGDKVATTVMSSQGCPFKCAFCCKNYKTVRLRSVEHVTAELDYLQREYGYTAIAFPDDLFILDRKRTERMCEVLAERGITWRCLVRGDLIVKYGKEFVEMMRQSGCTDVGMGVESGSNKMLRIINKGESIETIREAVWILKNADIRVKGFFILGLPSEDKDSIQATNRFLAEAQLDDVDVKIYQPYKGTPIWDNRHLYDIKWMECDDYSKMFYKGKKGEYYGTVYTSKISNEEIYDAWVEMESKYKWKLCG